MQSIRLHTSQLNVVQLNVKIQMNRSHDAALGGNETRQQQHSQMQQRKRTRAQTSPINEYIQERYSFVRRHVACDIKCIGVFVRHFHFRMIFLVSFSSDDVRKANIQNFHCNYYIFDSIFMTMNADNQTILFKPIYCKRSI